MDEYFVEEKSSGEKFLDFLVFIAVFVVTIFLILQIAASSKYISLDITKIDQIYYWVNLVVLLIFLIDLVRLFKQSDGWSDFFKTNWLDILATIPFGLIAEQGAAFQLLKLSRLSKLMKLQKISKISKISKEFKAASHLKQESEEYSKKHRL